MFGTDTKYMTLQTLRIDNFHKNNTYILIQIVNLWFMLNHIQKAFFSTHKNKPTNIFYIAKNE